MNLKEFVHKNNLVAFDVTSYVSCSIIGSCILNEKNN